MLRFRIKKSINLRGRHVGGGLLQKAACPSTNWMQTTEWAVPSRTNPGLHSYSQTLPNKFSLEQVIFPKNNSGKLSSQKICSVKKIGL